MRSYRVTEFGAPLSEVDAQTPRPSGREVVLRVKAAGVCHSDLHIWEGGYDLGHGRRLSLKDRGIALPLTMGHETVGEPPSPMLPPSGCRFRTRCPRADQRCATEVPELRAVGASQFAACHHPLS